MRKISISILLGVILSFFSITSFSQTGDPWIKKIYNMLYMRDPNAFEYNINNYNYGQWNNYNELLEYVKQYTNSVVSNKMSVSTYNLGNGQSAAVFYQNGSKIAADLISNDGGSIVAQGGGNIVAQGGGNIVAQGGGNLQGLPGVSFGGKFGTLAAGAKRVPVSGKGAWIIK